MKLFLVIATTLLFAVGAPPKKVEKPAKTILIIRHAKSDKSNPNWVDFERPLNDRGRRDAPKMGKRLVKKNFGVDLIVSSPSNRTTETAQLIANEIGYDTANIVWNRGIYRCSSSRLIEIINALPDDHDTIMIIGHNPASTYCSNYFQKDTVIDKVPTCGMVSITFQVDSWKKAGPKNGEFNFFDYPKKQ